MLASRKHLLSGGACMTCMAAVRCLEGSNLSQGWTHAVARAASRHLGAGCRDGRRCVRADKASSVGVLGKVGRVELGQLPQTLHMMQGRVFVREVS